ncbi:hypothetical protein [Microvirga alba]|uniref:Uncharacterized protein n=1 Tax=Microvirga alba TaxID=2791025 RepID=A0A931BSE2_9HYPH|nr:hypothetical protein [Microvirga alba]MBF9234849.1 hypothetical protein [Microvirga alba]
MRWTFEAPAPILANVVATAGEVVLTADLMGTSVRWSGGVISYQFDDKQMIAAVSGPSSVFFGGSVTTNLTVLPSPERPRARRLPGHRLVSFRPSARIRAA